MTETYYEHHYKVLATDAFANAAIVYEGGNIRDAEDAFDEAKSKVGLKYAQVELVDVIDRATYDGE